MSITLACCYDYKIYHYIHRRFAPHNSHTDMAPDEMFTSHQWDHYIKTVSKLWTSFYTNWLNFNMCILVVDFHNLKTNLKQELARIGDFLGVERRFLNETHLECVENNAEGKFKRRTNKQVMDIYTEELRTIVNDEARIIADLVWDKTKYKLDFPWE